MASRRAKPRQDAGEQRIREAAAEIYRVVRPVTLDEITVLGEVQVRVNGLDEQRVEQYVEFLLAGGSFKDPIDLFEDGERLILGAGWHRREAYKRALERFVPSADVPELAPLKAEIHPGGLPAAIEWAEEDNLAHGLELSPRDKRNILERRIKREHEWARLSNKSIAAKLGVSDMTVARWRVEIEAESGGTNVAPERVGADGKAYDVSAQQLAAAREALEKVDLPPIDDAQLDDLRAWLFTSVRDLKTLLGKGGKFRPSLPWALRLELEAEEPRLSLLNWVRGELPKWKEEQEQERRAAIEQEKAGRWQRGTHFDQRKPEEREAILAQIRERILAALADGPMRSIELMGALNNPAPEPFRLAREQLKKEGRIIEETVAGGRVSYRLAPVLSGNSLQMTPGEQAGGWLERSAVKTPSMATAANGEPAHSDDHNPDIEAALLLRSELERRVLRALDAIGAVLTIQGIRSLYLLDADQLRGLYGDLNDLSALGAEIHEYAEMQLGRMRLMGRTGRPYDEEGEA